MNYFGIETEVNCKKKYEFKCKEKSHKKSIEQMAIQRFLCMHAHNVSTNTNFAHSCGCRCNENANRKSFLIQNTKKYIINNKWIFVLLLWRAIVAVVKACSSRVIFCLKHFHANRIHFYSIPAKH